MTTLQSLLASDEALSTHVTRHLPAREADRFPALLKCLRDQLHVDPSREVVLVSAPGRTELAGNHTDHNHGKVLAAAVQLDTIAAVSSRDDDEVVLASEGFPLVEVNLGDLAIRESERETTSALVRGLAAAFVNDNWKVGGFDAAVSSLVGAGSGLSSSASVEVLIGTIMDHLFNSDAVGPTGVAKAGQFAENHFFGKPCGLMDQVACATGGIVAIDFRNNEDPEITRLEADFADAGLSLLVVDTGGGHADLTHEYASIPADMRAVAGSLGGETLADVARKDLLANLTRVRGAAGDRAVARALHFFAENERVEAMVTALANGDFETYLSLMSQSGRSSAMFLQNCAPATAPDDQAVVIALALTEWFFASAGLENGIQAACRVHGGGFAGTIQVLLPADSTTNYRNFIEPLLGAGTVTRLKVRSTGAVAWERRLTRM